MQTSNASPDYVPGAVKWLGAAVASLWVSIPAAVQVLIVLMAIDWACGLIGAALAGKLSSAEGFRGLARKTLTLLLVATAWYVSRSMGLGINLGTTVAMAFTVNELISITENCARAGVPIPDSLLVVVVRARRVAGNSKSAAEVEQELEGSLK